MLCSLHSKQGGLDFEDPVPSHDWNHGVHSVGTLLTGRENTTTIIPHGIATEYLLTASSYPLSPGTSQSI